MTRPLGFRSWGDLPLPAKGLVVMGLPVLAVVVMGFSAIRMQRADEQAERLVRHAFEVRSTIEQFHTAIVNAEAGARGFLLTNDDGFLQPFTEAERTLPALARRLDELVRADGVRGQLPELNVLVARRMSQWRDLIRRDDGAAGGDLGSRLREERDTMLVLRGVLRALLDEENRLLAQRTEAHARLRLTNRRVLMAGLGVGVLGGSLATLLLTNGIVRRAQRLEVSAGALAAGEPLDDEIAGGDDELGRVHEAMRRASRLLREREGALRQAGDSILELNAELERRLQQQAALNSELEAFSYSVSHDLRAPLRSIDGFSQALLEDYHDRLDAAGRQYLTRVRLAAQRMAQLIDDILLLSRVTRAELRVTDVDLSALAREIADTLHEHEPARRVEWRIAPGLRAKGDPQLLRIALENLLNNAWKFTGRHPDAAIELFTDEDGAYVVRDNGAGFDMMYADKLFGAFQRLHAAGDFAGTGVGLATVQRIISKHGGRVWARGEVERGASFFFTLNDPKRRDT